MPSCDGFCERSTTAPIQTRAFFFDASAALRGPSQQLGRKTLSLYGQKILAPGAMCTFRRRCKAFAQSFTAVASDAIEVVLLVPVRVTAVTLPSAYSCYTPLINAQLSFVLLRCTPTATQHAVCRSPRQCYIVISACHRDTQLGSASACPRRRLVHRITDAKYLRWLQ